MADKNPFQRGDAPWGTQKRKYEKPKVEIIKPMEKVAGTCRTNPIAKKFPGQPNRYGGVCTPPNLYS